jgi:DNA primase
MEVTKYRGTDLPLLRCCRWVTIAGMVGHHKTERWVTIIRNQQIDLVEYLEKLGYQPQKNRNNHYWYLSPFREEKEPSFKVNRQLNLWYDSGLGKGGSLIDFGILYYNCSLEDVLEKLSTSLFFHGHTRTVQRPRANTQKA